jgi:hypothetical protein
MKYYTINDGLIVNFGQPTKNSQGTLDIKYINGNKVYDFIENTFKETLTI